MNEQLSKDLRAAADPVKAAFFPRFFKAGPGQYAEGDKFLGVTVPNQRQIAKNYFSMPLSEVEILLQSEWHEERLTALFILVNKFNKGSKQEREDVYNFYLSHTKCVNNWDLVDSSSAYIVGPYLDSRPEKMKVLTRLAQSESLWERRIAMLATFYYINKCKRADEALEIAEILLNDPHDLIQKAVGWMLREIGKRVDRQILVDYLLPRYKTMPRTILRYAIEHFDPEVRSSYLQGKIS